MFIVDGHQRTVKYPEVSVDRYLLRIEDVCAATSLGRTKVYNEVAAGRIKVVKIGRAVRIPADELAAYVARVKAESGLTEPATVA